MEELASLKTNPLNDLATAAEDAAKAAEQAGEALNLAVIAAKAAAAAARAMVVAASSGQLVPSSEPDNAVEPEEGVVSDAVEEAASVAGSVGSESDDDATSQESDASSIVAETPITDDAELATTADLNKGTATVNAMNTPSPSPSSSSTTPEKLAPAAAAVNAAAAGGKLKRKSKMHKHPHRGNHTRKL